MLNSDVTGLLVCFLSQGGFKGAFVSVDLSKEHADTSGQVNCVKKKKTQFFEYFESECGALVFPRRRRQVSVSSPPFPFTSSG